MKRIIYEVYAKVVDANGAYNTLSGYPKAYDSRNYDNDLVKTYNRAKGEYNTCLGTMYPRDDRQAQFALLIDASTGLVLESAYIGEIAELPDPEPEQAE